VTTTSTSAVLRASDQRRDRSPARCVKTGERTERATRVRASGLEHADRWEAALGSRLTQLLATVMRRPSTSVVLAVSEPAWRRWRRRLGAATVMTTFGLGIAVIGAVGGEPGGVLFGLGLVAIGWWIRLRAWRRWWVGLSFDADTGDIRVTRVHPGFSDEARRLWVDSLGR
jgi:hypothetical protein